jgi:quinoprotein glucose dehydrogenase
VIGTPQVDWAWGKKFRAYDKATGKVIAEVELPSGTTGAPMTYMHKGKQYIIVPVGAKDHPAEFVALGLTGDQTRDRRQRTAVARSARRSGCIIEAHATQAARRGSEDFPGRRESACSRSAKRRASWA